MNDNNEMNTCSLSKNLKKLMKQERFSLADLSNLTGISKSSLFSYLHGVVPKIQNIKKLCKFLGVSSDELLFGLRDSNNKTIKKGDIVNCKIKILKICKDIKEQST